ncbi:hypothetical protein L2E82_30563 [Cichorium intybus]|uniref:Uncharacterized protein n=1 Tax=Cichorium intybus TaxID=13427 RepID=A0ACB9D1F0_CICIN|nr:hypothetical protein L2E82_30563 [Cichorium intybus]
MDRIIQRIEEALHIQEKVDALIEYVTQDFRFSNGKPVAALTIYKYLLHWKYLEAERATVFERLIKIFNSAVEDEDDNHRMAYSLSNACNLLFLIQESSSTIRKPPPPTSMLGRMIMAVRSSSHEAHVEANARLKVSQLVEVKIPALHFMQLLTEHVEKVYGIIGDNFKKELVSLVPLCIQVPPTSKSEPTFNRWQLIVDLLNNLLNTMKENFVPPIIVQKIFAQLFSFINVQLFASLLWRPECCTFCNMEYVKAGLAKLEIWCFAKDEYAGTALDELKHIRKDVGLLTIYEKHKTSYKHITNNICNIQRLQAFRIRNKSSNPIYNDQHISQDVISSATILIDSDHARINFFPLNNNLSIPFSVDDLSISMKVEDFANVKPTKELTKYPAFHFCTTKAWNITY